MHPKIPSPHLPGRFRSAIFLYWIASILSITCVDAAERPNVLFIAIDDLRPELGCYGSKIAISPNIDMLASRGVRFDNAHCQLAVCNPSRVSLLTGLRPDSTQVWTLDVRFRDTIPDATTLPQHFKKNGYTTLGFGKIFHNPWPDNISWSEPHSWPKTSQLWSEPAKKDLKEFKEKLRKQGVPKAKIDRLRATATEQVDIPDIDHIDGAIAVQALKAMERLAESDEPFFLAAGFVRPHLPFVVPEKYWDLYDRDSIPLASNSHLPENAPPYAMNTMYELRDYFDYLYTPDPRNGSLTEAQQRELKHGYLASVSFIDAQVGKLLEHLNKLGLENNTIVVLWSDHGWKLGEHNSWCKQTNYEIDTRVPFIIYDPRCAGNGKSARSMVELIDIYPTLCDLAGMPIPKQLQGISLKPVLENPDTIVKQAAVSQFLRRQKNRRLMGYAYRTDKWRYIEWIDLTSGDTVDRELYDHSTDPSESKNVAGNAGYESVLENLGKALRSTLPLPLATVPARNLTRPTIAFKNETSRVLKLFWLPDGGDPKQVGEIRPGQTVTQRTSMGHRFKVEGYNKVYVISKPKATIRLIANKNANLPEDPPEIVSIVKGETIGIANFNRTAADSRKPQIVKALPYSK